MACAVINHVIGIPKNLDAPLPLPLPLPLNNNTSANRDELRDSLPLQVNKQNETDIAVVNAGRHGVKVIKSNLSKSEVKKVVASAVRHKI